MRTFLRNASLVAAALALAVLPLDAQSRSGSSSRSSSSSASHSSASHSSAPSHSSSSSSHSSASPSRSSSSSHSSYSSPSRSSSSSSSSRSSYSSPSRSSSSSSYSAPSRSSQSQGPSRSYNAQPQQRSGSSYSGAARSSQQMGTRSSYGQPQQRSGSSYSGAARSGQQMGARSSYGQPQGAVRQLNGSSMSPRSANINGSPRPQAGARMSNFNGQGPDRVRIDGGRPGERIHPRNMEPMHYDRPSRFWDRGPHYFGHRIDCLPPMHHCYHYHGIPYYYCDGLWYRYWDDFYYVCRPPYGYCFDPIAADLALAACSFAYYIDTYNTYSAVDAYAQEIAAQNATIAANNATIAQQNATIAMNADRAQAAYATANSVGAVQSYADASAEYFYQDGVFYTKGADGQYTVVVPPAGALVDELPADYDEVTINGVKYYKVDDTLYRMTIVDAKACFEVVGQLTAEMAAQAAASK